MLIELNYLDKKEVSPDDDWTETEKKAYENYIGMNNFENRLVDLETIWKSIYDYMKKERSTPYIDLRTMSDKKITKN